MCLACGTPWKSPLRSRGVLYCAGLPPFGIFYAVVAPPSRAPRRANPSEAATSRASGPQRRTPAKGLAKRDPKGNLGPFVRRAVAGGLRKAGRSVDRNEFFANIWEAYEAGGPLTACGWCGSVLIQGEWIEPPPGVLSTIEAPMIISHSICPRCLAAQPAPKSREEPTLRAEQPDT